MNLGKAKRTIMTIKTEIEVTHDPLEINKYFYISMLVFLNQKISQPLRQQVFFLDHLDLPQVTASDPQAINKNISEEVVFSTIKSLPTYKSPGPDDFSGEFYKTFWPQLSFYVNGK